MKKLIAFTTEEDLKLLETIEKFLEKSPQSYTDTFWLLVGGRSQTQISNDLNLSYKHITRTCEGFKRICKANNISQTLTILIPALTRKECDEFLDDVINERLKRIKDD